jgi:hypothetical protein
MAGNDEIIFNGAYKDFKVGVHFDLGGRTADEVVYALGYIGSAIEPHAYRFSGIDTKEIEAFANPEGTGLKAVYDFLQTKTPKAIQAALAEALPKDELMDVAESYLLNRLLKRAGVRFTAESSATLTPQEEEIGDHIAFIAKYGSWMAIKKLGLEKVQDYEVSAILCSTNHTLVNKGFDFAGTKADVPVIGKRKTLGNLCAALTELAPKLSGGSEDAFRIIKAMEGVGYRPYASPDMLTAAYPDIKPPKMRGRKPKG